MQLPDDWTGLIRDWSRALQAENKSKRTIGIYTTAARDLGCWLNREDETAAGDVGAREVRDFVAHLVETTSPGNANTNYRALQQWFKFLIIEDEVEAHPMADMKPPHVPEKLVPIVPDDLLKRVLEACSGKDFVSRRDTALIRIIFDTGARLAEIANLSLDDLDFNVDAVQVLGKGGKARAAAKGARQAR
jgi:integrase/recombinase XerC